MRWVPNLDLSYVERLWHLQLPTFKERRDAIQKWHSCLTILEPWHSEAMALLLSIVAAWHCEAKLKHEVIIKG